jgi:hypothetical protein
LILDILVVDNGGYYVPVVATGGFSDAPGSIYRSILSSCSYYWKIFTTGASYLTTGTLCTGQLSSKDNFHYWTTFIKRQLSSKDNFHHWTAFIKRQISPKDNFCLLR